MTTIVICADHGARRVAVPGTTVLSAPKLCWHPGQLAGLVPPEETSLVLALHGGDSATGRVQAAVRRIGFDPLGVGVVDLERIGDSRSLSIALAALSARIGAFPGSRPEQVKLVRRPTRTTRRSLLSLGPPAYTGAPAIDESRCVAHDGCRACVSACPADALTWGGGVVAYDKTACVACGICVTTCPTGAVVNPVVTPAAVEAEVRAAISASSEPIGIRYVCAGGPSPFVPGWHRVEVPCTGMIPVGWLLAPLALGAGSVTAAICRESECERGLSARTESTLADASTVLDAIGIGAARVEGDAPVPRPLAAPSAPSGLFDAGSTQRSIVALHEGFAPGPGFVALAAADTGSIEIDVATCTACEMCATVCPTDALRSANVADEVRIDFDPRSCVACGQCVTVCPEIDRGAIRLDRGFDVDEWRLGRREVRRERTARCELCGKPVAPAAMLARISAVLGDEHSGTLALIGRRCIDCRGR